MVLSGKERAALWRQRQRENPALHEQYKQKERERNKNRKEKGDKSRKSIQEMSARDQRKKRREWRKAKSNSRERRKRLLESLPDTPPNSPPHVRGPHHQVAVDNNQRRVGIMRRSGRRKLKRDRAKAYRTIEKLQVTLFKQTRLLEKWKKRYQRTHSNTKSDLHKRANSIIRKGETKKALMLFHTITDRIKERYRMSKTNQEKRHISSIVCAYQTLRHYRMGLYAKRTLGITVNKIRETKKCIKVTTRSKKMVSEFLNRDDNSRVKAGKKDTITRKGEKRQIRLLNYDLKTLHEKFLTEMSCKISYSLFCRFKPFHILRPTAKDRDTCLCRTCQNINLKLEKCFQEKVLKSREVEKVLQSITCNIERKECMYRECILCNDNEVTFDQMVHLGKQVSWFTWKTKHVDKEVVLNGDTFLKKVAVTAKERDFGSLEVLQKEVNDDIKRVSKHFFNIRHQYRTLKNLRENLSADEIIVHIDFSENYNCKYSSEIQSMHFGSSQKQISLHTGVAYSKGRVLSFCTVSDCLKHNPAGIWAHLHPVLEYLRNETTATIIHIISDGPTTQYRNKQNFYLLANKVFSYGFRSATWNFLEAGHGKGAADGIGAVVKRTADAYVNKGGDITNSVDLVKALESSSIKLMIISEQNIKDVDEELPLSLKAIPKTMQIHQIVVISKGTISHRPLSCFCSRPQLVCRCFQPESASFPIQSDFDRASSSTHEPEPILENNQLHRITEVDESLVSQHCVVKYDGRAYPGVILSVDEDEEIEVKTMHRVGRNRFFWPMLEDTLWYAKGNVITLLKDPPRPVTKRHVEVDPAIWELIEKEEDEI